MSAEELATAARAAVAAGAEDIHLHPKTPDGVDSLDPVVLARAVACVREAVPGVPVGVTTGAWTAPDAAERAALVRSWTVLPDTASVNWHEEGAERVAEALSERGVGVEAGLFTGTDAVGRFLASGFARRVLRVLVEVVPGTAAAGGVGAAAGAEAAIAALEELREGYRGAVLLHGEAEQAWPVLRLAAERGLDRRIGLEDTLTLPDGRRAPDNAALVRAALAG
ncbi:uncharacterized protein (DUF849 family) [Allostreptomyces psammosilenae]|uniref:Uncharacterized protein (DUF849 family) n=1 Tax=Allostreptomyces psammosilenae TaxID=1892865 RepID=A0A852ZZ16_9ACTN|nr:uncharacterized protein (DUF849 family) [Allostreptomyces psammosilenae]